MREMKSLFVAGRQSGKTRTTMALMEAWWNEEVGIYLLVRSWPML
jgi:hypothetical protein